MENDYYYTKYLKYKAKYINLIKQTGGEAKDPIIYTKEQLLAEIRDFGKNSYSLSSKFCNKDCTHSTYTTRIKKKDFQFYKNNLCVFAEYTYNYGVYNFTKLYLGELVSNETKFNNYGVSDR